MLSEKNKIDLLDQMITPIHHLPFVHKWVHDDSRPPHITDILCRLSQMGKAERSKFYFVDDEMYVVDYKPEKLVKHAVDGWKHSKTFVISRKI